MSLPRHHRRFTGVPTARRRLATLAAAAALLVGVVPVASGAWAMDEAESDAEPTSGEVIDVVDEVAGSDLETTGDAYVVEEAVEAADAGDVEAEVTETAAPAEDASATDGATEAAEVSSATAPAVGSATVVPRATAPQGDNEGFFQQGDDRDPGGWGGVNNENIPSDGARFLDASSDAAVSGDLTVTWRVDTTTGVDHFIAEFPVAGYTTETMSHNGSEALVVPMPVPDRSEGGVVYFLYVDSSGATTQQRYVYTGEADYPGMPSGPREVNASVWSSTQGADGSVNYRFSVTGEQAGTALPENPCDAGERSALLRSAQGNAGTGEAPNGSLKAYLGAIDFPMPECGTFSLVKALEGIEASAFPTDTTFQVTATWDGGSGSFDLPVTGEIVLSDLQLPAGTVVTFAEGEVVTPEGYEFVGVAFSPESVTIAGDTTVAVTVTNTYRALGTFSLAKALSGIEASDFPQGTTFPVTATWQDGDVTVTESFDLPVTGEVVGSEYQLPAGTVVTFVEGEPVTVDGYTFTGAEFSPESVTIGAGTTVAVTLTNTYTPVPPPAVGSFSVAKVLSGIEASEFPEGTTFQVVASWEGGSETLNLPVTGDVVLSQFGLPVGTVVTFAEGEAVTVDGYTFTGAQFSPASVTIEADTTVAVTLTNTYEGEEPTTPPTTTPPTTPPTTTPPTTTPTQPGKPGLPNTGASTLLPLTLGLLAIGGGAAMLAANRRRRGASQ